MSLLKRRLYCLKIKTVFSKRVKRFDAPFQCCVTVSTLRHVEKTNLPVPYVIFSAIVRLNRIGSCWTNPICFLRRVFLDRGTFTR